MNKNLSVNCWGPSLWHSLHSIAYSYNKNDQDKYLKFFMSLGDVLPCEECKIHYKENVNESVLIQALQTDEGLFRWVYDLHNLVNQQKGIPESKWPSFESVLQKYDSFSSSCVQIPGVCGATDTKKMIVVLETQFTQKEIIFIVVIILLIMIIIFLIIRKKKFF